MNKLTNRHLTLIIIVLLSVIAFPVLKSGYKSVANSLKNQIERNKSSYCKRKFPDFIKNAISKEELKSLVDDILAKDVYGSNDMMYKDEYNNPKGLSTHEMLTKLHSWRLEDKQFYAAYFDSYSNKCTRGSVYVSDELPWYRL